MFPQEEWVAWDLFRERTTKTKANTAEMKKRKPMAWKTHSRPNRSAIYPDSVDAKDPRPKVKKNWIPYAVPRKLTLVYRAKRWTDVGCVEK